jgi:integrase
MEWSLYDGSGHRKYLTERERTAFIKAAAHQDGPVFTFCLVLKETGCRISEALELTPNQIDLSAGVIIFRCLKKRRPGVHRAVPVSSKVLSTLQEVNDIRHKQKDSDAEDTRLWPWHRATAHRYVTAVMGEAKITGPHATAKGLRHGFGVAALSRGVPINILQKWLGHASLSTTAIYGDAVGAEERKMARKMWNK